MEKVALSMGRPGMLPTRPIVCSLDLHRPLLTAGRAFFSQKYLICFPSAAVGAVKLHLLSPHLVSDLSLNLAGLLILKQLTQLPVKSSGGKRATQEAVRFAMLCFEGLEAAFGLA
jgi:hypothetical protein